MIPAFVAILVVYALALAAVCAWSTIRGTGPARWQLARGRGLVAIVFSRRLSNLLLPA